MNNLRKNSRSIRSFSKRLVSVMLTLGLALLSGTLNSSQALATTTEISTELSTVGYHYRGWIKDGDNWKFVEYGTGQTGWAQTGWLEYEGKWYYFDPETAFMKTGWFQDGGSTWYYCFTKDDASRGNIEGAMVTNQWVLTNSKWYYLKDNGAMAVNEWISNLYGSLWVGADGAMKTGWFQDSSSTWYYGFTKDDASKGYMEGITATNQWILTNGKWYYLKDNGAMAVNELVPNVSWYEKHVFGNAWVDENGAWDGLY